MNYDLRRNNVGLLLKILSRRAHGKGGIQSPDDDEPGLWSLHWWRALPDRERAMALTLRFTADYRDRLDYTIVEDGRRNVGRLYEDRHSRPELRWFWSITVYINPDLGITTSGRAPTMNEAKEHFLCNWQKCRTVSSCPVPLYSVRVSECRPKSRVVRPSRS
jgi:hypothetical protein